MDTSFLSLKDDASSHVLEWEAESWFAEVLEVYTSHFSMKREDASVFVGMDVDDDQGQLTLKAHLDHRRWKLQHGCSAKSNAEKVSILVGQFCNICDRCLRSDICETLAEFLVHASHLGYCIKLLNTSKWRFLKRHPYLRHEFDRGFELMAHIGVELTVFG